MGLVQSLIIKVSVLHQNILKAVLLTLQAHLVVNVNIIMPCQMENVNINHLLPNPAVNLETLIQDNVNNVRMVLF